MFCASLKSNKYNLFPQEVDIDIYEQIFAKIINGSADL